MKKILCAVLAIVMTLCLFASCGGNTNTNPADDDKLSVVCTVFPQYDWIREILGEKTENVSLMLLLDSGTDLHSYQPTAADLMKISSADIFVYVGGESDKWVADALKNAAENVKSVNLLDALGDMAKSESEAGIMEEEEEEEEEAFDEHIWLSLKNAVKLCGVLTEELCALDSANADVYRENSRAYCEKLGALDADFEKAVASAANKTFVCADRFPFMYLFEDYGLKYFAAFSGCSAESEASFKTVVGLAEKADEYGLKYICQTENPLADIAKTVIETTSGKNQQILTLDSLQSVTAEKVAEGKTYYSAMEQNINALKKGLEG